MQCDQCQMLSIQGVPCHERGCPNARKTWFPDRGWVRMAECWDCGGEVEEGEACSCHVDADDAEAWAHENIAPHMMRSEALA
jgi:hypothetical protein